MIFLKAPAVPCKPYFRALKLQLQSNRLPSHQAAFLEDQEQHYQYESVVIQIQVLDFWLYDTAYIIYVIYQGRPIKSEELTDGELQPIL
jgi:hypothetical protein